MRVSTIALSTLAALAAQELASTHSVSPSTNSAPPDWSEADVDRAFGSETPTPVEPIALPEILSAQQFAVSGLQPQAKQNAQPELASANPGLPALPSLPTFQATSLPLPPPPIPVGRPVSPADLATIPIDDIIDATLKRDTSLLATTVSVKENSRPTAQPAIALQTEGSSASSSLASTAKLNDIQAHWAKQFIEALADQGMIRGFPDGSFRPSDPITRAQFLTLLQKAFPDRNLPANAQWLNSRQNLSRSQALAVLVDHLDLKAHQVSAADLSDYFRDAAAIAEPEQTQIAAAVEHRLIVNYPDVQALNPNRVATRADAAAFIYQALVSRGQSSPAQATTPAIAPPESPLPTVTPADPAVTVPVTDSTPTTLATSSPASNSLATTPPDEEAITPSTGSEMSMTVAPTALEPTAPPAAFSTPNKFQTVAFTQSAASSSAATKQLSQPTGAVLPTLTAAAIAPQDEAYTLGAGDRVRLEFAEVPEYSGEYQVLVNGTLNLPLVGNVSVQGMTLRQAGENLAVRYSSLLKRPLVTVHLLAPRPLNIAIAGEINRPGAYTISLKDNAKFPTITSAIQQAGGFTQSANLKQVQVRRPQRSGPDQIIQLDLQALVQTGDLRQDISLRDGDSIWIPANAEINLAETPQLAAASFAADTSQPLNIAVVGEVMRPGPYVLTPDAEKGGKPTVTQAIQQAGGITQLANIRQVQIRRPTRSGAPQMVAVDLWQLLKAGDLNQDLLLQQGDTIVIPTATTPDASEATQLAAASFSPDSIRINVVGEVVNPGVVEVPPNTPLNQALLAAGGFNKRSRKKSVELIRLNPNGTVSRQAVPIDLASGINAQSNPILRPNDIIVVGRSGAAKFGDTIDSIVGPLGRLLPFALF